MTVIDRRGRVLAATLVAACLHLASTPARAGDEDTAAARQLFERAEAEYRLGNFQAALDHYKGALKLARRPSLLFNIAQCYRHLKDAERALFYYKLYLADWGQEHPGILAPSASEVQMHIANLTAELRAAEERKRHTEISRARRERPARPAPAVGRLRITGLVVARAELLLDGVGRTITPSAAPIEVAPGLHRVRIDAPGHRPLLREVSIRPGEEATVIADLSPLPQRRRRTAWLAGSIASLALAGGAEAAAIAFTSRANEHFDGSPAYEADRRWVIAGHVTAGTLAALSVTAFVLYLRSGESTGPAAAVLPLPSGAVASAALRF